MLITIKTFVKELWFIITMPFQFITYRKVLKMERENTFTHANNSVKGIFNGVFEQTKTEENKEKRELTTEDKERLALCMLLSSNNENDLNVACDYIKELHFVDDYE